jgi:hypothetical protein
MRWKSWQGPKSGEKQIVKYFAIAPTKLDDGYTVWLETYWAVETWDDGTTSTGVGYWKTTRTSIEHPDKPNTGSPVRRP